MLDFTISPTTWASCVLPTPWSRLPMRDLSDTHPLPPPAPLHGRYMHPRWRGRGILFFNLNRIFKGLRPLYPHGRWLSLRQKALNSGGLSKGGRQAPLWNEIIDYYPPPVPTGYRPYPVSLTGGGRWWAPDSLPIQQERRGWDSPRAITPRRKSWQQERGPEHCYQPCGLV